MTHRLSPRADAGKARSGLARLLAAALLAPALLACTLPASAAEIRVMVFNIWLGGDQVSMSKTLEAIQRADADLVLLQEPEGNTAFIGEALGYAYAAPRHHALSRLPLFDNGEQLFVELEPGRFAVVANVHLDWTDYGPYAARDGRSAEEVLAVETANRLSGIEPVIASLEPLAAAGMPAIIGGDFNSPGDDWTEAMVGTRPHIKFPLAWPAAKAVREAGYQDTWRTAHPDALANPGITWSWGYPQPLLWENETQDRIDLLFARNATVKAAEIVGGAGIPDVSIAVTPFPSDHQAVVATLELEGTSAPTMIVPVRHAVTQGQPILLRYSVAGIADGRLEGGWIELLPAGGAAGEPLQILWSNDTTDRMALVKGSSAGMAPGAYDAALISPDGNELARTGFEIVAPDAVAEIASDKASYKPGETIVARFANAPGQGKDWVTIYPAATPDQWNYLAFAYTGGATSGEIALDEASLGMKLEPGDYELRLMLDDGYVAVARSAAFTVTAE